MSFPNGGDSQTECDKGDIHRNGKYSRNFDPEEIEKMLPEDFDNLFQTLPITDDTSCGFWMFKGSMLQK